MNKLKDTSYTIRLLTPEDNTPVAELIRTNLKAHGLNIPGTVYFDPDLYKLYDFYSQSEDRDFYVLVNEDGKIIGCIGFADYAFPDCAELQKLYIDDSVKGQGLSYKLIDFIEEKMVLKGYKKSYLETHTNLERAIHVYESFGYERIPRPKQVAHGTMDHFYIKNIV